MKKTASIFMAFALCLSLCSCGGAGGGNVFSTVLLILLTLLFAFLAVLQTNTAVRYMRRPTFSSRSKKRKGPVILTVVLYLLAVFFLFLALVSAGAFKAIPASGGEVESTASTTHSTSSEVGSETSSGGTSSEDASSLAPPVSSAEDIPVSSSPSSEAENVRQDWMTLPSDYKISAKSYFAYSTNSKEFLMSSGEHSAKVYPASVTKLFTAYVALEHLSLRHIITVDDALDLVAWDASVAGLKKGDMLTVEMLIEAMLLPSGNDAAYVLAVEIGRMLEQNMSLTAKEAADVFVNEMNRQASLVGLEHSHFVNPDGMPDDDHYLSISDLALVGELALQNETIRKYASTQKDRVTFYSGKKKTWENTNELLDPNSEFYCPIAIGLKTGTTTPAGCCILSAYEINGDTVIIGVFKAANHHRRYEDTLYILNKLLKSGKI